MSPSTGGGGSLYGHTRTHTDTHRHTHTQRELTAAPTCVRHGPSRTESSTSCRCPGPLRYWYTLGCCTPLSHAAIRKTHTHGHLGEASTPTQPTARRIGSCGPSVNLPTTKPHPQTPNLLPPSPTATPTPHRSNPTRHGRDCDGHRPSPLQEPTNGQLELTTAPYAVPPCAATPPPIVVLHTPN